MNVDERLIAASAALDSGDSRGAFAKIRPLLTYPGHVSDPKVWKSALECLARIATPVAGDALGKSIRAAAATPNDVAILQGLGAALVAEGLFEIAATVLARANTITPGREAVVTEFVVALERSGRSDVACEVLRQNPKLTESSPACSYLLAINAIMSGNLDEPRKRLPALAKATGDVETYMAKTIEGMLARADAVRGATPLDETDLRGWHFVLNGSILLHVSQFDAEEGMNGRYAYTQDSADRCVEAIERLRAVLEIWGATPPRIFAPNDRMSVVLAEATATRLGVPVLPWKQSASNEAGLVVAYDLRELDAATVDSLRIHRPRQTVWSHATCWLSDQPFAADITSYLYQFNEPSWGSAFAFDPTTDKVQRVVPEGDKAKDLGSKLASAKIDPAALSDLPTLQRLAEAAAALDGPHAAGASRGSGARRRHWLGSPVPSSRMT